MTKQHDTTESHYLPAFTRRNGLKRETVCGKWITFKEHTTEPTCAECRRFLEAEASITDVDAEADRLFGPVRS